MTDKNKPITITSIKLDPILYMKQRHIDFREVEISVNFSNRLRGITENYVLEILATVFSHRQVKSKRIEFQHIFNYPATWWQHLKRDHFPAWYLKKWPIKYMTAESKQGKIIRFIRDEIVDCPELQRAAREGGGYIYIHENIEVGDISGNMP